MSKGDAAAGGHRPRQALPDQVRRRHRPRGGSACGPSTASASPLSEGETLGLVGESGCGKSTLCRAILQLVQPTSGSVASTGRNWSAAHAAELRPLRREMQMIFQDPYASLNPRMRVRQIIGEPLRACTVWPTARELKRARAGTARPRRAAGRAPATATRTNSPAASASASASPGRWRCSPSCIVRDEPVSALDVSIQAQIINLLEDLQDEFGLTYLFIAHDLSVVRHICDRVAVMYLGQIVETRAVRRAVRQSAAPLHRGAAVGGADPRPAQELQRERIMLEGDVPSPIDPPPGCQFHTRCASATDICCTEEPALAELEPGHFAACHHPRRSPAVR